MFQYTKETVLNNPEIEVIKGVTNPYTLKECNQIVIKGVGEYYSDCIDANVIFKTVGYEGKPGKLTFKAIEGVEGEHEYLLTFRVVTPNQFYAEYASPAFKDFGKPMVIGFRAAKDEVLTKMMEAIEMAIPVDNKFILIDKAAGTLTGSSNYMTFDRVKLEWYDPTKCESCEGEYAEVASGDDLATIDANVESFATGQWILENLRFPTYPNIRYASSSTQMPHVGETYVEYAFTYAVPRVGLGGLSGVGQKMDAVTRHIFFVPEDKVSDFEKFDGFEYRVPSTGAEGEANASKGIVVNDAVDAAAKTVSAKTKDQTPKEE